ncbi:unnamed protein product [Rhizoctonia solani]|uniref:P-loop containing nucleoside triphosphate hydrolase protein n=1 Tax=Rhizoctonia solani TaxID=456999 RepID=A0A8H3BC32_9AGAM|nr:unnamed protein product [Rhizoctonia solani]
MDISGKANPNANTPALIILCGLVGSGKSTFATALQREFPEFRRCNQDELGRREDVEREVYTALAQGLSVCVDRTNFDPSQRRTWIDIARQYPEVEIWGVMMDTPYETCHARLIERKDHPTLRTPEKAVEVLSRFSSQFTPINANEGFNRRLSERAHTPHHWIHYPLFSIILEGAAAVAEALSLLTGIAVTAHPTLTVGAPIMHHHGVRILETPHNEIGTAGAPKTQFQPMRIEEAMATRTEVGAGIADEEVPTSARLAGTTVLIPEEVHQGLGINQPLDLYLLCATPVNTPLNLKILMFLVRLDIIYHTD